MTPNGRIKSLAYLNPKFVGFEKSLLRFNELIKRLPNKFQNDVLENRKYNMLESQDMEPVHDARYSSDTRILATIIGLNQRLQTYMKEGTIARDPENSFYSIFGEFQKHFIGTTTSLT